MCTTSILVLFDTLCHIGTLAMISWGFHTSQWSVYEKGCGCDSDCIYFIGLQKAKYTKQGKCDYEVDDADCDKYNLKGDDCDNYESALDTAQLSLAIICILVVLLLVATVMVCKCLKERSRMIWLVMAAVAIGDIILAICVFVVCGNYSQMYNEFDVVNVNTGKQIDFDLGSGWKTFLAGGFLAFATALYTAVILRRGIDPPPPKDEPAASNQA
mmetsp:Transcript_22910/g.33473  ORF Transcript_22910/g.33473 Transcript_22910/m.33473 type:complete len:214 (-) Transcript_22910:147-788(-)